MKEKDIWPNPYQPDTPTSLIAAAFRLLYFNVQEGVRECWQHAHRMTYGECEHPMGSVEPGGWQNRETIVCRKCGRYVGRAMVRIHLNAAQPNPEDCPPVIPLEAFCSAGFYRSIPAEYWLEPRNSDI